MPTKPISSVLFVTFIALAACQSKGPVPSESASPAAEAEPSPQRAARPVAPADSVHGAAQAGTPKLPFTAPASWESQAVSSSMRKAQYRIPGQAGDAELVVFYFGPQGAGSDEDNINRWVSQFQNPDGTPVAAAEPSKRQVNGVEVTTVEVAGRYVAAMQGGTDPRHGQEGQRMLAAIIKTGEGPHYLKMLGPDATVSENRDGFEQLLKSLRQSD